MIPFLSNSPLYTLFMSFSRNNNINSEWFEVLVSALDGKSMEELFIRRCNIRDISALQTYNIPNLRELVLNGNNIGREGCITISNLLKKESTVLTEVFLIDTGVNDEGVEIIANSLKHNTTLEKLNLTRNGITEKGCKVFLKLLVDVRIHTNPITL